MVARRLIPADGKIDAPVVALPVMPAQAGVYGFPMLRPRKAWMAARSLSSGLTRGAAMTVVQRRCVIVLAG